MATNTLLAEAVDEASMAEASRDEASVKQLMEVSVGAAEQNGGAVALTDHGLKARQVLLLREPLSGWAASVVVTLDLSRNKLRDRGAAAVAEVLAGSATIERLELEHNGIGDVGATSLAAMLRIHPVLHSLNMRRNLLTDTGARALVVAMHEVPRIQHLDITRNKHVTHSMAEAARLAAETNRVRQKALAALDKLATLYESVGVIKGELGFAANMPLIGALQQACAVLGVGLPPGEEEGEEHDGDGGVDGDEGKEAGDLQTAAGGGGDDEQSSPAETRPSRKKPWLAEQAAAVLFELDKQMVEVAAQDCGDPVIRSLALGYTAQPAEVAELDAIARRAGVKMSDVLGFARAQQEAERALAKADVDPVMEDESARRRRLKKAIRAAEAEANRPAPTVLEQLAEILELAVQRGLLTSVAASKIRERVHAGRLQPATTLVQWTKKLRDMGSYPDAGGAQQQQGDRPSEPIWRAVHDERSGNTYYYNRVTRETTWTRPPSLAPDRQQPANVAEEKTQQHGDGGEEDSDGDDRLAFEEWNFSPPRQVRPGQQSQPQLPPAASSSVEWAQEEPASEDEDRMPARQSGAAGFAVDDVVVEITAEESRKLPFRECEDGRVEIARVSQKAQEFGLRVGMLLHSLAAVGGGERQPVGMLSYGGVMDQIRCMARAGGGLTLGFVRRPPSQPVPAAPTDVPTLQPALQLQHQQAAAAAQARQRGPTLPQPGDRYVVEFRDGAMLRAGSEMESAAAGRLSYGQVVTVLESRVNQIGIVRLRVDGGWASVRASDGTVLMRKAPYGLDGAVTTLAPSAQFGIGGGADLDFDEDADAGMLLPPPAPPRTAAQKAAALVERALEHDTAEEVADAISCYQRAAKLLKLAAKEKCSRTQVAYYRSKGAEYIARAEELSELVAEQRRRDAERQQLLEKAAEQLALATHPLSDGGTPLNAKETRSAQKRAAKACRRLRKDPAKASCEDVSAWLGSIGLAYCAAAFLEQSIDGVTLVELDEAQLRDDLGVTRMGDRARIQREIAALTAPPRGDGGDNETAADSATASTLGGASASTRARQQGLRGAQPPPPPAADTRVKISARWGVGGDWVHVKMDVDEITLPAVKQRLATTMQLSPLAFNYMQYQDAQGNWFAILQDDDLTDGIAELGGKRLVLQSLQQMR